MSGPDLYVLTVVFLALKKTVFSEKKNSSQKQNFFFLPFFYATFQCGRYNVFKKKKFAHKKLKTPPSKVAQEYSIFFLLMAAQTAQTDVAYRPTVYITTIYKYHTARPRCTLSLFREKFSIERGQYDLEMWNTDLQK